MAQMNVSVPSPMKDWCEDQVRDGRFSTTSDDVRDLIRRDQDSRVGARTLQSMIDEGVESGKSSRTLDEIFAEARSRANALASDEG
mgnify:CR=1 FL=1